MTFYQLLKHYSNFLIKEDLFRINSNSNVGNTYFKFVEYLTKKSELLGVTICELETFLFGWDLTSKQLKNYLNPRIVYNQFFSLPYQNK